MDNENQLYFPKIKTELSFAQLFADRYGLNVRYDHKRKRFLTWTGNFWEEERNGKIQRYIYSLCEEIRIYGEKNDNKSYIEWAIKAQTNAKFNSITNLIKSELPISISGDEFDRDPMLLGVKNGIIDLSTGLLRPGRREDYISMFSPVEYDPEATCGIWEEYMETTFEEDHEKIDYLQMALGYSLTGSMKEQLVFICYGEGENGKTMFFSVIDYILGDYAKTASSNLFKKNTFNTQTNDVADIEGARFVTNAESIKGAYLDEERIKSISGGDKITARRLHANNTTFRPQCKIWLYTNNYPKIDDDSHGMKRRLVVVRFPHQITAEEKVDDYDQVMLQEAPGILNWFIKGWLKCKENPRGLKNKPASIIDATKDYYEKNIKIFDYIEDRTIKDEESEVLSTLIYLDYTRWMAERRKAPVSQTAFGRMMDSLHYDKIHKRDGTYYKGLHIKIS